MDSRRTPSLHMLKDIKWTSVGLPILFAFAALFYCKLGYMAIVGCKCDVKGLRDFETKLATLVKEIHGTNTTDGLEYSLPDLAERLTRLETGMSNKETVGKECIDSARKEIESMLTGGVAAGCLQKRGLKGALGPIVLVLLVVLQVCSIFGIRYLYKKTKELESLLNENNDKKKL